MNSVRDTVRQRTYERYGSIVWVVHLAPAVGKVQLKGLRPDDVHRLYRES